MKRHLLALASILALAFTADGASPAVLTIGELTEAQRLCTTGFAYRVRGTVLQITRLSDYVGIYFRDKTGIMSVSCIPSRLPEGLKPGDEIEACGSFDNPQRINFNDLNVTIIGHGDAPEPDTLSDREISNGMFNQRYVRARGIVRDAFLDEIDPNWIFLVLSVNGRIVTATCPAFGMSGKAGDYLGAEVEITGIGATNCSQRRFSGTVIVMPDASAIRSTSPILRDPFTAPALEAVDYGNPEQVSGLGRRCVSGMVTAVWQGNMFLLRGDSGQATTVQATDGALPSYGDRVTASGLPETDYYRIILAHAVWRKEEPCGQAILTSARDVSPAELLENATGQFRVNTTAYGQVIRICGTVRHLPSESSHDRRIFIEAGGYLVPVEVGSVPEVLPRLQLGCRIAASGVCIMEYERNAVPGRFTRIRGFAVVPRTPEDIHILARPSWWTPSRLFALLGIALAVLVGIVIWNISLNRRARRKGKELAQEQLARVASELKADERTRLAVELHDAMSQNISGAALQINAAIRLSDTDRAKALRRLDIAAKTLQSCREELRNCIWDLRSQALEEPDFDHAIRRMLSVSLGDIDLTIRFNVPRQKLTDNVAHAILKAIRELAANAVRHGKATSVRVAGALDGDGLRFSVTDNGTGFDPDNRPGIAEGHFGLQGIAERVKQFDGAMKIDSRIGSGCKVVIALPMVANSGGTLPTT